jgi:hypothetical protein
VCVSLSLFSLLQNHLYLSHTYESDSQKCNCFDFCNGQFMGCTSTMTNEEAEGCDGEWVRGCSTAMAADHAGSDQRQQELGLSKERSLQDNRKYPPLLTSTKATTDGCPAGQFKSDAMSSCIPCLSCPLNSQQKVSCVTYVPDIDQCECDDGFKPNLRNTGCLPVTPTTSGSIAGAEIPTTPPRMINLMPPPPPPTSPTLAPMAVSQVFPSPPPDCPMGYFKSSPDPYSLCVPCLLCGSNSFSKVDCVTYVPDPDQCECNPGFLPNNRRTGCYPVIKLTLPGLPQNPPPTSTPVAVARPVATGGGTPVFSPAVAANPVMPPMTSPVMPPVAANPVMPPMASPVMLPVAANPVMPPMASPIMPPVAANPVMPPMASPVMPPVAANPVMPPMASPIATPVASVAGPPVQSQSCPPGTFKSSAGPDSPCVPCLSCPCNSSPKTSCVTYVPDQCECHDGFQPNVRRSGCYPTITNTDVMGKTMGDTCPDGFFQSSQQMECGPCLTCPSNAVPKVPCVTYIPNHCECSPGFRFNVCRTECLPMSTTGSSVSLSDSIQEAPGSSAAGAVRNNGYFTTATSLATVLVAMFVVVVW